MNMVVSLSHLLNIVQGTLSTNNSICNLTSPLLSNLQRSSTTLPWSLLIGWCMKITKIFLCRFLCN
jgi:hypothetical protein